jgi:hypothetical protein
MGFTWRDVNVMFNFGYFVSLLKKYIQIFYQRFVNFSCSSELDSPVLIYGLSLLIQFMLYDLCFLSSGYCWIMNTCLSLYHICSYFKLVVFVFLIINGSSEIFIMLLIILFFITLFKLVAIIMTSIHLTYLYLIYIL